MKKFVLISAVLALAGSVNASWYWPFGEEEEDQPRLSELMYDATTIIDDATELAADGKIQEAVAKYREALIELAKVEANNPERAATAEFSSLRNKRAYVSAAIDSLLLAEARANAKAVAVTDTTELEQRYLRRKRGEPDDRPRVKAPAEEKSVASPKVKTPPKKTAKPAAPKKSGIEIVTARLAKDPENRKLRLALVGEYIKAEKYDQAKAEIETLLKANMTDASALNLRAVCEASQGDFKSAEATLDLAIQSHPRDYNGYYNMANLKLQGAGNKDIATRYYETGRALGGPKDEALEAALK